MTARKSPVTAREAGLMTGRVIRCVTGRGAAVGREAGR